MLKKNKFLLIILFAILSGFGRSYVMKNINNVLNHTLNGVPNYARSEFHFLQNLSSNELYSLKWLLTIVWTIYFLIFTYLSIKLIFPQRKQHLKAVVYGYTALVIVSTIIYLKGYFTNDIGGVYNTVRNIMGIAQSFIPLMVFYLIFKFMLNDNDYSERK